MVVIRQYPTSSSNKGGSIADQIAKEIAHLCKRFPDLDWDVSNIWSIACDGADRVYHEILVQYAGI